MRHNPWLLLLLASLLGLVVGANYVPGTWLTGWDNLHPEFDFFLNIKRSVFAAWQEYQGLGLLGGMGHAAALPRELLLWVTSLILPAAILRYAWTFGMYIFGGIGVYLLLHHMLHRRLPALAGSIFYLCNLATIQIFTVPFEAFITHYGFLPWFVLSAVMYLEHPTRKRLFFLAIIHFLGATQAYIPTLFVVYLFVLAIICIRRVNLKRIAVVWATVFAVNAFWLLPWAYFVTTQSHVTVNAKINQMATEEVYLRNRAYGDILSTAQLKNFLFDTLDFDPQRSINDPVLGNLRTYFEKPAVTVLLFIGFGIVLFGAGVVLKGKKLHANRGWIMGMFLLSLSMLTTDTPPFSWINTLLRDHVPLFGQAFRFPFTKFGILAGFSYSLLFGIGTAKLLKAKLIIPILCVILGVQAYPILSGNLFYKPMRTAIPKEYFDLFAYLKTAPPGRITNLPQPTFWGWSYYRWGYTGSGFVWYGVEQPIMDRAFDPWSQANENYYWQLSLALYRKDPTAISRVLDRYDISYVLLDNNMVSPSHNRALFAQEIEVLLPQLADFQLEQTFGNLKLYSRKNPDSQNFVSLRGALPQAGPTYIWSDTDAAYDELGDYITGEGGYQYPNRTLFTKREPLTAPPVAIDETNLVFDASASSTLLASSVLNPQAVIPCGLLKSGTANAEFTNQGLRLHSTNQRGCLSFSLGPLPHTDGYVVAVESNHISGRPLLFSLINQTAKHTEVETYLPAQAGLPSTNYFILPPLAPDGLGYSVYIANDAIGRQITENELSRIRVYRIPYNDLLAQRSGTSASASGELTGTISVAHPNPAYYLAKLDPASQGKNQPKTLIVNQAYDPGWIAFEKTATFPFLKPIGDHVLVNNWANGWVINPTNPTNVVIFFLPQLWEFLGFALLPIPFLLLLSKRPRP